MSILIIDDSPDQRNLLRMMLNSAGHTDILAADSASAAFKHLGLDGQGQGAADVDLILMDVMMPDMDGIETCRRIRANERLRDIPIIVITAKTEPEYLLLAFTAGAMDYLRKPLNSAELQARVCSALLLKHEMDRRKAREQELQERTEALRQREQDLTKSNEELQQALKQVKVLRGLIPICSSCKRIRNDQNYWQRLEDYLQEHSEALFSQILCVECAKKLYPGVYKV